MAQVTRLPHDGRMIMGGKGSITPFSQSQTNSSKAKSQSTAPSGDMSDLKTAASIQTKVDLEPDTMTTTKTPVSTLMDRQRRHDFAMKEAEMYLLKNPKAPPPKKETPE